MECTVHNLTPHRILSKASLRIIRLALSLVLSIGCLVASAPHASADFDFEVYDGSFDVLPDFGPLTPIATGTSTTIDVLVTSQTETFALVFTIQINVPTTGDYEFFTNSDDGSILYIDGSVVVDNDGLHGAASVANSTTLNAGLHDLRVEFFEKSGGEVLDVGYRSGNPAFEPIPSDGQFDYYSSNESIFGKWGPVIQWPHIAISAANLPDGRILSWSSTETNAFPSGPTFTHASVFDPVGESFLNADSNFHDMFCAGVATLEDGTIFASGGNPSDRRTSTFDPNTLVWSPRADMIDRRWYATSVALPDNRIFASFGKDSGNRSEVYDPVSNTWTATPNANMQTLVNEQNAIQSAPNPTGALNHEWWSHLTMAPQGDIMMAGPTQTYHRFDPIGGAPNVVLGQMIGDTPRMYGNAVNYDSGKMLLIGGADRRANPPTTVNNVYLIDLNGPAPILTSGAPMNFPRALSNSVTLPDGRVLVIGGNTVAKIFNDEGSVLPAEIYDPGADTWTVVDSITIPRNYHSTALLLKDARILSAGGGACGNCSANHLDGQIFSPPYLFESDDSPAIRPTVSLTPGTSVHAGDDLVVTASAGTTSFSIVRLSATTHHLNTDQRFLPLSSVDNGDGTFTLSFPANPNILIMGNYWLFALDSDGTPSVGETIQVTRASVPVQEPQGGVYVSDLVWSSEQNGLGPIERDRSNGDTGAADGGPINLDGIVYPKGVGVHAFSEIDVPLGGLYDRFFSRIGLDDERDGLCGDVSFEVDVDSFNVFASGSFIDTSPTGVVDVDVSGALLLTLRVFDNGDACGDAGDWADARLVPTVFPGYRYYRFRSTELRDDGGADSIQLSELSLFQGASRINAFGVTNPGGNNSGNEAAGRADDGNTGTKWRDLNRQPLVYDMGQNVEIDFYTFTTANDNTGRDPIRWAFEASTDGVNWVILDDQTGADYPTPTARQTEISQIALTSLVPVTALPDAPRHSSTLIVETSSGADRVWNVNPDNDTVSVVDEAGTLLAEIPVGDRPWSLAKQPGVDRVFVTNKDSSTVSVIDTVLLSVDHTFALARGAQPHGIAFSSDGVHYFLVLEATATVEKRIAASHALADSLVLSGTPRHLSMRYDDSRIFVSNFVTPPVPDEHTVNPDVANGAGQVFSVNPGSMSLVGTIGLPHDDRGQSEVQGPGLPNYLGAAVVSFDDLFAYVPTKKDNIQTGLLRGMPGMTFESTVRANTSRINLSTGLEDPLFRVDHDNSGVATSAALSGDDRYLFVTLEASRELAIYDIQSGFQLMRLPTGRAPQSVALSSDGSRAYVHNFLDRSVSRFDLSEMLQTNLPATNLLTPVDVVGAEDLSPTVLLGKQHFYDAADDRIALDNYISCASCHKNGMDDGRVWDLGQFGEGLRKTISLRGRGDHGIRHWSGNFDEVQDFEIQIRNLNFGFGFLTPAQFTDAGAPLGTQKAGLSPDLDALAAYVDSLTDAPDSPLRPSAGTMSASAQAGQLEFANNGCLGCHTATNLTDSPLALRHDVGTIDAASGQRLSGTLDGFDTPGLVGAWATPPFLHDGEAQTIEAAITAHSAFAGLPGAAVTELADFLREVEVGDLPDFDDDDNDGTPNISDPAPADPCAPTAFVSACAQDSDGDGTSDFNEGEIADGDADGSPDYTESSIADADLDGVADQFDAANANACVPAIFVAACAQDTDGDGTSNFAEGEFVDSDGDGLLDWAESSITDTDSDGSPDQSDLANADPCAPNVFVGACGQDTDGDGATDFAEGEFTDSDGDGLLDWFESSLADADSDGVSDQADPANVDACDPEVFIAVCTQDSDSDGSTDFEESELADGDGDGIPDYLESSLDDADSDFVFDQFDPANEDACDPNPAICNPVPVGGLTLRIGLGLMLMLIGGGLVRRRGSSDR
jgi:YVTN family beta-propeller protein